MEVTFKINKYFFARIVDGEMNQNDLILILIFSIGLLTIILLVFMLVNIISCCKTKRDTEKNKPNENASSPISLPENPSKKTTATTNFFENSPRPNLQGKQTLKVRYQSDQIIEDNARSTVFRQSENIMTSMNARSIIRSVEGMPIENRNASNNKP